MPRMRKRLPEKSAPVKAPPYSDEAEQAVLGCILYKPKKLRACTKVGLQPEAFYVPRNRIIYDAICAIANAGQSPDSVMVTQKLRDADQLDMIGGVMFLNSLLDTPSVSHMEHYLEVLQGKFKRRQLIELCQTAIEQAYTNNEKEVALLSKVKHNFHKLSFIEEKPESIVEITYRLERSYREARDTGTVGLRSRWFSFNNHMLGYPAGKVSVVAARPSLGKTTMAVNEALYQALTGNPALIISLEMSREELVERLISDMMGIDLELMKSGKASYTDRQRFVRGGEIIASLPLYIEDQVCNVEQVSALMRDYREEKGVVFAVVDYIQIIASTTGERFQNRNAELGHMSRMLAHTAKDTNIHTMVLSQLSRPVSRDNWFNWEPELHHLRDSGAIEQDAFMVAFLYQDPNEGDELWEDNAPTIFKVAKIRGARVSKTHMIFQKSCVRFTETNEFTLRHILKEKFPHKPIKAVEGIRQTVEATDEEEEVPF